MAFHMARQNLKAGLHLQSQQYPNSMLVLLSCMSLPTHSSCMFSTIFGRFALTQRLQQGPCPSAGEDKHKVALGIDIEVRVPRHIGVQHKFFHFVRLAVKEDVQAPAAQAIKSPYTRTGTAH